jgi:hypothetical protein
LVCFEQELEVPGTVTVACKLANGLCLDLKGRERVIINGSAVPFGMPSHPDGYALTHGVDADFFVEWLSLYKDMDAVKKRFIFAYPKAADASAAAREMRDEKCGLEPLDPDNPGRGLERVGA